LFYLCLEVSSSLRKPSTFKGERSSMACTHNELKQLKVELERELPKIFAILGEAINASNVPGNFDLEIRLNSVNVVNAVDSSNGGSGQTPPSQTRTFSIVVNDEQVLQARGGWRKPCPDPGIAPNGCWT
jgi:hypothetical protein